MRCFPPSRIVCLSAETFETLHLIGEHHRVVGVSGFADRPAEAAKGLPRVSGFSSVDVGAVLSLSPDLVMGFSDVQSGFCAELGKAGLAVHLFNQRDIAGILAMIRTVSAMVGRGETGDEAAARIEERLAETRRLTGRLRSPRVYFEEWGPDPLVCGIGWVSELIAAAGGTDVFSGKAKGQAARSRQVSAEEVASLEPDIVIASWCGRKADLASMPKRAGWETLPAIRSGWVREMPASPILQPGPGALTEGLAALSRLIEEWRGSPGASERRMP
jgi:iron complex transport system substrate-binding protein